MKKGYITYSIILWLCFVSCVGTFMVSCDTMHEPTLAEKPPIVVEGWIEEDDYPVVIVTHAVDLTETTATFDDVVEKWCRVSIFDGEERYLLTGRLNKDYTPSFIFTTTHLKGKVGHTYRLLIETETDTIESAATMMDAPDLLPLTLKQVADNDTSYYIRADLHGVDLTGYYKFFVKSNANDSHYYGSFLGTFAGEDYDETNGFDITRGIHSGYSTEVFDHYFHPGDVVNVKLCSLEYSVYDFWKVYEQNTYMSENLFFTFDSNCPTNIKGGIGYWAAYGVSKRLVVIPKERER